MNPTNLRRDRISQHVLITVNLGLNEAPCIRSLDTPVYFAQAPAVPHPIHILSKDGAKLTPYPKSLTLRQVLFGVAFPTSGRLPDGENRPLNPADRLFHSVDRVSRPRQKPIEFLMASIVDRVDVASSFLSALPAWVYTFFGEEAFEAWILPNYAMEVDIYEFLLDEHDIWNGSWSSPYDTQTQADCLLPYSSNLPVVIDNMSFVTATQAQAKQIPFKRHVQFTTGIASLGKQSTTTSPGIKPAIKKRKSDDDSDPYDALTAAGTTKAGAEADD